MLRAMEREGGLRERKKQQTREAISGAARRLFWERGFDAVTVVDVAAAADVSPATVFNYFKTKEDLFFSGLEAFERQLLDAVRARAAGESALTAFRRLIVDGARRLADAEAADVTARAAEIIRASPALQARELEVHARHAEALADLLATETGAPPADVEAAVAAAALVAAHRAVVARIRAEASAGRRGRRLVDAAKSEAVRAFARLEAGLKDYAVRG